MEKSPFNNVKVVSIIVLVDDVLPFSAELLKHSIQHLRHLFLRWRKMSFKIREFPLLKTIVQKPASGPFQLLENNHLSKLCTVY